MPLENDADLTTENDDNIGSQTAPESITPALLAEVIQSVIDSKWSRVDDLLTLPPADITRAALATAIGASALNDRTNGLSDKQWLQITDRTDGNPLFVQILGANQISPFGIWVKAGKPLSVIMDYVNGYQGETNPFIAIFNENRNLYLPNPIIIADGTNGSGRSLISDSNGKSSWKKSAIYSSAILNPAAISGSGGKMLGLAAVITALVTGECTIIISGEYVTDTLAQNVNLIIKTNTGTPPANGDAITGGTVQVNHRLPSSDTLRIPFSLNAYAGIGLGAAQWFDIALSNDAAGTVQLFNVSVTIVEK